MDHAFRHVYGSLKFNLTMSVSTTYECLWLEQCQSYCGFWPWLPLIDASLPLVLSSYAVTIVELFHIVQIFFLIYVWSWYFHSGCYKLYIVLSLGSGWTSDPLLIEVLLHRLCLHQKGFAQMHSTQMCLQN